MGTKNYGLPTNVYGRISLRLAVLNGFKIIDKTLKEVQDAAGGTSAITTEQITDATALGRSLVKAANPEAARAAIGAGTSDFSGSYADLENKPTIPAAATVDNLGGAGTTGKAVMKAANPEAARAAIGAGTSDFSGSYADLENKPTIPAAPATGTGALIEAGTDGTQRLWSAAVLAAEIDRRIAAAIPPEV